MKFTVPCRKSSLHLRYIQGKSGPLYSAVIIQHSTVLHKHHLYYLSRPVDQKESATSSFIITSVLYRTAPYRPVPYRTEPKGVRATHSISINSRIQIQVPSVTYKSNTDCVADNSILHTCNTRNNSLLAVIWHNTIQYDTI